MMGSGSFAIIYSNVKAEWVFEVPSPNLKPL